jgi:hypothetical protein
MKSGLRRGYTYQTPEFYRVTTAWENSEFAAHFAASIGILNGTVSYRP